MPALRSWLCGFNPRAPRGARPRKTRLCRWCLEFQSTRPARGATQMRFSPNNRFLFQSTRPARGATCRHVGVASYDLGFNPRAPRGARRCSALECVFLQRFQSTRPARGATVSIANSAQPLLFQSTRPARGATPVRTLTRAKVLFQSTRPARGATPVLDRWARWETVSIHAPRAGRDVQTVAVFFLPRVSIHAPRAGRDSMASGPCAW